MAKGRKTGGRTAGTPNKASAGMKSLLAEMLPDDRHGAGETERGEPWRTGVSVYRAIMRLMFLDKLAPLPNDLSSEVLSVKSHVKATSQ
jgi:hypothetical protein